ncbi:hypothetical protein K402DRAFT_458065 [Aulographum hederae CBS 113979]|uniref:Uncharacterized protein n=1 Tax=Aulographum hederae CBS 113979 TaxID=1176131 RepID=A0A6G1GKK5_9PEZI|nr:hypothetical protein K402DRAFT_458065 [Aulographum hederae CBS 113979]
MVPGASVEDKLAALPSLLRENPAIRQHSHAPSLSHEQVLTGSGNPLRTNEEREWEEYATWLRGYGDESEVGPVQESQPEEMLRGEPKPRRLIVPAAAIAIEWPGRQGLANADNHNNLQDHTSASAGHAASLTSISEARDLAESHERPTLRYPTPIHHIPLWRLEVMATNFAAEDPFGPGKNVDQHPRPYRGRKTDANHLWCDTATKQWASNFGGYLPGGCNWDENRMSPCVTRRAMLRVENPAQDVDRISLEALFAVRKFPKGWLSDNQIAFRRRTWERRPAQRNTKYPPDIPGLGQIQPAIKSRSSKDLSSKGWKKWTPLTFDYAAV